MGRGGGRGGLAVVSQSTISSIHHGNYLASPRVLCPLAALSQVIMIRRRWAEIYTFRRLSIILGTPCGDPGEVHTGYQRAADARLLVLVRAAVCWLLMKMLCDEQPGCGARGPANPRPWLHRSPWPPAGNVQCVSHVTTCIHWTQHWQGFAHSPLLSALQTIIPGFCCQDICRIGPFLALACHHCCIQDTCCSVTPLTRTMPPP